MSADGAGLFSDDVACDVRAMYREAVAGGASDGDARASVLAGFAETLDDTDETVVVRLALAHTQSVLGRLDPETHREAVALLDAGADVERWRAELGERGASARIAELDRVRRQLDGPQPARRRIRPPTPAVSRLAQGDVLGYRARSGRLYLVRVVAMVETTAFRAPLLRYLDHARPSIPSHDELAGVVDVAGRAAYIVVIEGARERRESHGIEQIGTVGPRPGDPAPEIPYDDSVRSTGWPGVTAWMMARDAEFSRLGFSPLLRDGAPDTP